MSMQKWVYHMSASTVTRQILVSSHQLSMRPVSYTHLDVYKRQVMASCAIPAVCRPVEIDGRFYYDGGVSDSIPVQKAMDDGLSLIHI